MDKFDRGLEVIRKLLKTATKLQVKIDKHHLALAEQLKELAQQRRKLAAEVRGLLRAQLQTDRKFGRLLGFWANQRSNGYRPKG